MYKSTKISLLFVLFLTSIIFFNGCKKDDNPTSPNGSISGSGSITLTGDGYSNSKTNFTYSTGAYVADSNYTIIVGYGTTSTDSIYVVLSFRGKTTGDYAWASSYYDLFSVTSYNTSKYYISINSGTTKITKYGSVGGTIEGTFSGTLTNVTSSATVTVSGSFSAIRLPDETYTGAQKTFISNFKLKQLK